MANKSGDWWRQTKLLQGGRRGSFRTLRVTALYGTRHIRTGSRCPTKSTWKGKESRGQKLLPKPRILPAPRATTRTSDNEVQPSSGTCDTPATTCSAEVVPTRREARARVCVRMREVELACRLPNSTLATRRALHSSGVGASTSSFNALQPEIQPLDSCTTGLGGGRAAATTSTGGGAVVIPGSTTMVPWTTKPGEMTPQDRADDKAKHR